MDPTWYATTKWYNNLKTRGNGGKNLARRLVLHYIMQVLQCLSHGNIHAIQNCRWKLSCTQMHAQCTKEKSRRYCQCAALIDWTTENRGITAAYRVLPYNKASAHNVLGRISLSEGTEESARRAVTHFEDELEVYRAIGDDEGVASATTNIASAKSMYEVTNGATQVWGQKPRSDASRDQGYHCQWKIGES